MDDVLLEVARLLYGDGADELIHKMNPAQSDIAARKDRRQRTVTAGLSATGAAAGAYGLGYAGKEMYRAVKTGSKIGRGTKALAGLEVAGLGGELMATKILHNDVKKKPRLKPIKKSLEDYSSKRKVQLKAVNVGVTGAKKGMELGKGQLKKLEKKGVCKSETQIDVKWEGEFSKVDSDKQQVFGWASIVELNGEPVVDLQGDYIAIDEVEKSAYEYVHKSRKGGDMHLRDGDQAVHKSDMIESFVVTPEKKKALGLPDDTPVGWWVGYQINDAELWGKVKSGERTGFSIHGRGVRTDA